MVNELYLTLCYRPAAGVAAGCARAAARRRRARAQPELALAEALSACVKLRQTVCAALDASTIRKLLGAYRCGPHLVLLAA